MYKLAHRSKTMLSSHLAMHTKIIIWMNTHLTPPTFSRSDPRWPNGGHFSSQNSINWPKSQKLCRLAIWSSRPKLYSNTHLMTPTFSRSDPRWPNGGHFSSQNCITKPGDIIVFAWRAHISSFILDMSIVGFIIL